MDRQTFFRPRQTCIRSVSREAAIEAAKYGRKNSHVRKRREFGFATCYISCMKLDPDICYQALLIRDARFDGHFFAGVGTTGIYCRPVCPVKTPRRQNCSFFPSAAAAEAAGFRPCLRCRPELAPGNSSIEANARLAHRAAILIEDGTLEGLRLSGIGG